ncbi:MAG TPA: glycoside hydrolase family 130 protein [bacterium]|nr:glycoside hydrolase family 130 protein [bacterium]
MNSVNWKTHPCIRRHPANPVLSAKDVPYPAMLVFNAGVTKYQGRYVMVFRNDYGEVEKKKITGRNLGLAWSRDGVTWEVAREPLNGDPEHPLARAYDPRLTVLEGRVYMSFAISNHGTCAGVAVTDDFEKWEILNVSVPDNRNMVIFPERIGGKIVRLERPFAGYLRPGDRFDMWLSTSPDGRFWGESRVVLATYQVPWVNNKVGPGAPPVKTEKGWLTVFHGVDIDLSRHWGWEGNWNKRYCAGLALLDLKEPWRVIGLMREPLIVPEPEIACEAKGYRDYVIFPGGLVVEDDGRVKIYYGAADTVECLAEADLEELLRLCEQPPEVPLKG